MVEKKVEMLLRFNGVRGSRPTHRAGIFQYGGNSTNIEFVFPQEKVFVFLDGGSGLVPRGRELVSSRKTGDPGLDIYFLMTHTHWDHILGFPFFEPLYQKENHLTFFASKSTQSTFDNLFLGLQRVDHLPVPVETMKAKTDFKTVSPGENFFIQDRIQIKCHQINHQAITLGYRLEYLGCSVAVITDNAPISNGNYMGEGMKEQAIANPKAFEDSFDSGLINFLRNCHTVVFDTHFTDETIKPDWGHSTPTQALAFCIQAGVKRLILFHHAPEDSDQDVDAKVSSIAVEAKRHGIEVVAAKEGEWWTLK